MRGKTCARAKYFSTRSEKLLGEKIDKTPWKFREITYTTLQPCTPVARSLNGGFSPILFVIIFSQRACFFTRPARWERRESFTPATTHTGRVNRRSHGTFLWPRFFRVPSAGLRRFALAGTRFFRRPQPTRLAWDWMFFIIFRLKKTTNVDRDEHE